MSQPHIKIFIPHDDFIVVLIVLSDNCSTDEEKKGLYNFLYVKKDSCIGVPVTLKVEKHGFYLHWVDQNNEMDLVDIATIRDVRTGRFAKIPKDPKLRQIVTMGLQDTLEEKTVTVGCANDFVNINFINFCCTKKEIARLWTDSLMSLAYNLNQINGTTNIYLQKAYTKLTLITDKAGKIPIKNIVKMFGQHKDDKKRIESYLSSLGLPTGKNETVDPQLFTFQKFYDFYEKLTSRITDVGKIFDKMTDSKRELTAAQLVEFLNKTQRDPRLNEILHPYANIDRAREIIAQYEEDKHNVDRHCLSFHGFLKYLMSDENNIMSSTKLELHDDMDQTMAHYFINSSHNTYLTGHQITGKSSTEMYRQSLLAGCRCVELDFWNGRTDEPVIVHGYTFVPEISAKEVLEAIAETAFKTSDYPVILSFENHCNQKQQAKIANYCREIFGDMLLEMPLDSHKLEPGVPLPPPSALKRKIIIKNKKKHHHHHHKKNTPEALSPHQEVPAADTEVIGNGTIPRHPPLQARQGSKESTGTEDEASSSEEENESVHEPTEPTGAKDEGDKKQSETEAGAEISALVNYVQPVHFSSFENAKKKNRCYEMSSFDERQATSLLKEYPVQFVNYNKHQLSRVYPVGTRFDSANFMPQVFWNAGCQLVALNYQTLDLAMQLNVGIFEYNFRCGYLLKPEFMRRTDRRFYPFAESTVDGIIAGTVMITVISGQFLSDKRVGTYAEVEMYGLPADTVRKRFKTRVVPNNGINPIYDEEPFVFKKVVLPELASLRIVVYEESGKFIGHRILPVVGLCPGYRHVNLRNEIGQPLPLATLFLHIVVKDYVPDGLSDFAEALANPIKYQSELEKRAQQLAILTEDMEPTETDGKEVTRKCLATKAGREQVTNGSPVHRQSLPTGSHSVETPNDVEPTTSPVACGVNIAAETTIDVINSLTRPSDVKQIPEPVEQIVAEPLDKLLENKVVKEKKLELEKKLEALRKKHAKKKSTFQSQKSGEFGEKKPKLINMKLVKRLSSKNIISGVFSTESPSIEPLTDAADTSEAVDEEKQPTSLPRSHSERLLAINKDYMIQERELREKYHEIIYTTVEKVMKMSQGNQMKILKDQYQRDTAELMRKLQADHREEVKALARKHRNKEQFTRIKKEVVSAVVDRGVSEREKLTQQFNEKQDELTRQHEIVKEALYDQRAKAKAALTREFEVRLARLDGEASGGSQIECTN
ncbi:hypothetical protein WA026_014026 [Henosepilachna vigintioctopunctata]|uniref:1-phosphatidylinositol 4,5-bisphosphate phosphodiesterase n=1 Tax=Henosepilachna vigintioctopunctata TaxID=420089 RepID=A0AAW1U9E7_9CUCU